MANLFLDLPVPAGNGVGAAVDTSAMGEVRTITVQGDFVATITIEVSNDGGVDFAQLVSFTKAGKKTISIAAQFMRVRVGNLKPGVAFSVNVDVASNDLGGVYVNLPAPPGDGTGASIDVSALGTFNTAIVSGDFSGQVVIEISEDGVDFAQCFIFTRGDQQSKPVVAQFARVVRSGSKPGAVGTAQVDLGAINDAGGVGPSPTPSTCFVFRPGGVAADNVYTDWATLVAALATVPGCKTLEFDNSLAVITIPAGGPYDMTDVTWTSIPTSSLSPVIVNIPEGASFTRLRKFVGHSDASAFIVRSTATATPPVSDFVNNDNVVLDKVRIDNLGTTSFFSGAGLSGGQAVRFLLSATNISGSSVWDWSVAATTLELILFDGGDVLPNVVDVAAAAFINVSYFGNAQLFQPQAGIAGTRADFPLSPPRMAIFPTPPDAATGASFPVGINAIIRIDGTVSFTFTVPPALGFFGAFLVFKETEGGAVASIAPTGGDTIGGSGALIPLASFQSFVLVSDGISNWIPIADFKEFGMNFQSVASAARSTTTSATFQTKATLTTPALTGTYRVRGRALVDSDGTMEVRTQNTTDAATLGGTGIYQPVTTADRLAWVGDDLVVFAGVPKTLEVQFRSIGGDTAGISEARIEIWRAL